MRRRDRATTLRMAELLFDGPVRDRGSRLSTQLVRYSTLQQRVYCYCLRRPGTAVPGLRLRTRRESAEKSDLRHCGRPLDPQPEPVAGAKRRVWVEEVDALAADGGGRGDERPRGVGGRGVRPCLDRVISHTLAERNVLDDLHAVDECAGCGQLEDVAAAAVVEASGVP
eukprot:278580-Prymnesium_polylepis.1